MKVNDTRNIWGLLTFALWLDNRRSTLYTQPPQGISRTQSPERQYQPQ